MPNGESSMCFNCSGVAPARRGLSDTGNRNSLPLCIAITMFQSRYDALRAESINVLMPLLNDKLPMFFGKPLRFRQLPDLQSVRLAKLDDFPNIKHCFAAALLENFRHWNFVPSEPQPNSSSTPPNPSALARYARLVSRRYK